ncbi:MAG: NAD(P)H-binding protein [Bacteroidales bacterium]|jgi:uncharacterized protein YbjT (DUF2867 family)
MDSRTAIVFGSTGLIGNLLAEELVQSEKYVRIKSFVRQATGVTEVKVEEIVSDFSDPESFSGKITGDDLYICLGTTIRKAGSVANMEKIDRDLPIKIASIAAANGVKRLAVVSSLGASAGSANYYLRIKGEMEEAIMKLNFESISIVRPSMLLGERKEIRASEIVGKVVMTAFKPVLIGKLSKYRAIHGGDVARAMISLVLTAEGKNIIESSELQKLSSRY